MTKDEIIKLASQAIDDTRSEMDLPIPFVMRFAMLVAAAEREACAKACDERAEAWRAVTSDSQREAHAITGCGEIIRARGSQNHRIEG